jgi:hypothetical protein
MHPCLIDRPFVPHNLDIIPGEPCPFTKVLDGPPVLNLNILWVQERNPNIHFVVCAGTFICAQLNERVLLSTGVPKQGALLQNGSINQTDTVSSLKG